MTDISDVTRFMSADPTYRIGYLLKLGAKSNNHEVAFAPARSGEYGQLCPRIEMGFDLNMNGVPFVCDLPLIISSS
jgi:hypothetical protein